MVHERFGIFVFVYKAEVVFDLRGGDARRARQEDELAIILEVVKAIAVFPVTTHNDYVHMVVLHVADLLIPAFLRNDEVNVANGFEHHFARFVIVKRFFALAGVELIRGKRHDKIIAQRLCAF